MTSVKIKAFVLLLCTKQIFLYSIRGEKKLNLQKILKNINGTNTAFEKIVNNGFFFKNL